MLNYRQWLQENYQLPINYLDDGDGTSIASPDDFAASAASWLTKGPIGNFVKAMGDDISDRLPGKPTENPYNTPFGRNKFSRVEIPIHEEPHGVVARGIYPLQLPPDYRGQKTFKPGDYYIEKFLLRNRRPGNDYIERKAAQTYVEKGFESMVGDQIVQMGYANQVDISKPKIASIVVGDDLQVVITFKYNQE